MLLSHPYPWRLQNRQNIANFENDNRNKSVQPKLRSQETIKGVLDETKEKYNEDVDTKMFETANIIKNLEPQNTMSEIVTRTIINQNKVKSMCVHKLNEAERVRRISGDLLRNLYTQMPFRRP